MLQTLFKLLVLLTAVTCLPHQTVRSRRTRAAWFKAISSALAHSRCEVINCPRNSGLCVKEPTLRGERRRQNASARQPEAAAPGLRSSAGGTEQGGRGAAGPDGMEDDEEITAATLRGKPRPPPISAQSAFSYVPPRRLDPKEHSYYYRQGRAGIISLYDCIFKRNPGYNQKLHRDDREHAKSLGLHVNEEERERPVGVLTSSDYGKRIHQPVEPLNRDHRRASHVKADFYRKNDIPSIKAPGFGHISPA